MTTRLPPSPATAVTDDQVAEFIATLYYSEYSQATRPGAPTTS